MTEEAAKSPETVASVAENLFRAAQGLQHVVALQQCLHKYRRSIRLPLSLLLSCPLEQIFSQDWPPVWVVAVHRECGSKPKTKAPAER